MPKKGREKEAPGSRLHKKTTAEAMPQVWLPDQVVNNPLRFYYIGIIPPFIFPPADTAGYGRHWELLVPATSSGAIILVL